MEKLEATKKHTPDNIKQIRMDVGSCTVRLNLAAEKKDMAKIETVKRMILSGVGKV